ncbi:MAG: hypothetical protein ACI9MJ_001126 [Alphaproteobacteria bacterium]|jgi:hypothetical protein
MPRSGWIAARVPDTMSCLVRTSAGDDDNGDDDNHDIGDAQ